MQDFQSLCQNRRSIRKYTTQAVEQEKIDYEVYWYYWSNGSGSCCFERKNGKCKNHKKSYDGI